MTATKKRWALARYPALALCLALTSPAMAQDPVFDRIPLRVSGARPNGDIVVDRGERDRVQPGDKVVLLPRNGAVVHGSITKVMARTSVVTLVNRNDTIGPGVKGEVLVPRARRAPKPDPRPADPKPVEPRPTDPGATDPRPARPGRTIADDGWKPGMPLLAGSRPLHPAERSSRTTGRAYTTLDLTRTLSSFDHSFARAGTDFEVENPAGYGGTLRVHSEFAYLTEVSSDAGTDLRVFDLSYSLGGTRHDANGWQFGRFLHSAMPEFGVLDGVEFGHRTEDGSRYGVSLGFLPELDEDMETGADLQLAAWYLWPDTVAERLTWGFGFQKSWHRFGADRDLIVGKVRYLPLDGWDFAATTWIDIYYGSDSKGDGPELTRARAHAARHWRSGGLQFAYDHEEYPDLKRTELPQTIQPATLLNAHNDRISMHAYTESRAGTRWYVRTSGWSDESRAGGTGEVGFAANDLLLSESRTGLAAFHVQGPSSTLSGVRIDHGGDLGRGRLDLLGEVGFAHHEGILSDRDDLIQYRLGGYWTSGLGDSWDLTMYGDGTLWDEELSLSLGFYLQRIF